MVTWSSLHRQDGQGAAIGESSSARVGGSLLASTHDRRSRPVGHADSQFAVWFAWEVEDGGAWTARMHCQVLDAVCDGPSWPMRRGGEPRGLMFVGSRRSSATCLPISTPEDKLYTTSAISPQWVWWVAHVALGTTLGLVYVLFGPTPACRSAAAPRSSSRTGLPYGGLNIARGALSGTTHSPEDTERGCHVNEQVEKLTCQEFVELVTDYLGGPSPRWSGCASSSTSASATAARPPRADAPHDHAARSPDRRSPLTADANRF